MATRLLPFLLGCFILLSSAPAAVLAEDGAPEDSAAARLFREAWWKETGARDLAGAEKGYGEATAAEGSEHVRARALYRLGVVQQRQGRTAEAKATLAQLASRFPGQQEWLDKARRLTQSWSTTSVETSFSEWYQKHRYGPEFQKRILDLVLQLATTKPAAKDAREQLLIIGDAALPALQAHAGNRNVQLSASCIDMILELGAFPSAESLIWRTWPARKTMQRLLGTSGDVRKRLQSEFRAIANDGGRSREMRARARDIADMFDGPLVILERTLAAGEDGDGPGSQAMSWAAGEGADQSNIRHWMIDVAEDTTASKSIREWLLGDYIDAEWKELGLPRLRKWLDASSDELLQIHARNVLSDAHFGGPQAWKLRMPAMRSTSEQEDKGREAVAELVWSLASCPADQDLSPAIEALRAHPEKRHVVDATKRARYHLTGEKAITRVVESLIRTSKGVEAVSLASLWEEAHKKRKPTARMRAVWGDWASSAVHPDIRVLGTRGLARAGGLSADEIVRYMPGPKAPTKVRDEFFNALARNLKLAELDWDREKLRALLRAIDPGPLHLGAVTGKPHSSVWPGWPQMGVSGRQYEGRWYLKPQSAGAVFATLVQSPAILTMLQAEALENPGAVPVTFFQVVHPRLLAAAPVAAKDIQAALARWPKQKEADRLALLEHVRPGGMVPVVQHGEVISAIRGALPNLRGIGLGPAFRHRLFDLMATHLKLEDVQAMYDLSDPRYAMLTRGLVRRMPRTPALYEAYSSLLSGDAPGDGLHSFWDIFKTALAPGGDLSDLAPGFMRHALRHGGDTEGRFAVQLLEQRLTTDDESLWLMALGHKQASVREEAAGWVGRVYNRRMIAALVERMDDPNPDVRDAVMASLAAIEKVEEQKARWREKAKDWVKEPADK